MRDKIEAGLQEIEKLYGVRILYAVESGSRIWGFDSHNSDYDIRFIYVNAPAHYLAINERADCIDNTPLNTKVLDFAGWDLKKALRLFRKSNPPLFQWLVSPIEYRKPQYPIPQMRDLMSVAFNPTAGLFHYLNMAKGNYRTYLREGPEVITKKYFYVLHPLLACYDIETSHTDPAIVFDQLVEIYREKNFDFPVREVAELLRRKKAGEELGKGPLIPTVNNWIEEKIKYYETHSLVRPRTNEDQLGALSHLFMNTVLQCNYSKES